MHLKLHLFPYPSILTCVLGAQKNRLIETVLLSTHNIWFGWEIRKFLNTHSYLEACGHYSVISKPDTEAFYWTFVWNPLQINQLALELLNSYQFVSSQYLIWVIALITQQLNGQIDTAPVAVSRFPRNKGYMDKAETVEQFPSGH